MKPAIQASLICSGLLLLAACVGKPKIPDIPYDNLDYSAAVIEATPVMPVEIVQLPKPLPLPGQLKRLPGKGKKTGQGQQSPTDRILDANNSAKMEPVKSGYINAIQNYPYVKGALYQLYTAVNQVSDIALERGENLVSVSAGDTVRWVVGDTTSGTGNLTQVHILVKPIKSDLQTNLVIATDRRTYHLEMHSTESTYMASVSWVYPYSSLIVLQKQNARAIKANKIIIDNGLKLNRIKFRYRITGDAPWKPIRAFDDGKKVYIQFPTGLKQGEAPPLFVIASDGQPALVNYRVRDTYYIVDRLFAVAELRLGTDPQKIVRITRTDARVRSKRRKWGMINEH